MYTLLPSSGLRRGLANAKLPSAGIKGKLSLLGPLEKKQKITRTVFAHVACALTWLGIRAISTLTCSDRLTSSTL